MSIKEITENHEEKMKKAIEALRKEYGTLRAGRATPTLLERVLVDYYGTPSPISQVATISVPEPRLIAIKPFDSKMFAAIEKAIQKSDLGLNPTNDGMLIRLNIPQLTKERRSELCKIVNKKAEESKVAVRNLRRDANEAVKKMEKAKTATEDDVKKAQESIQKLTDKYIKEIDQVMAVKEKDIMEV
jgi:ribosome recycling factor